MSARRVASRTTGDLPINQLDKLRHQSQDGKGPQ
jgi:hypothetical protein